VSNAYYPAFNQPNVTAIGSVSGADPRRGDCGRRRTFGVDVVILARATTRPACWRLTSSAGTGMISPKLKAYPEAYLGTSSRVPESLSREWTNLGAPPLPRSWRRRRNISRRASGMSKRTTSAASKSSHTFMTISTRLASALRGERAAARRFTSWYRAGGGTGAVFSHWLNDRRVQGLRGVRMPRSCHHAAHCRDVTESTTNPHRNGCRTRRAAHERASHVQGHSVCRRTVGDLRCGARNRRRRGAPCATRRSTAHAFYRVARRSHAGTPAQRRRAHLNVWTAARAADERRRYGVGPRRRLQFAPRPVRDRRVAPGERGAVVVTFNYRLGVLASWRIPPRCRRAVRKLRAARSARRAALGEGEHRAVRRRPDNVTVFGESAGAHAIGILMARRSPRLNAQSVGQSGAFWTLHGSLPTFDERAHAASAFANRLVRRRPASPRDAAERSMLPLRGFSTDPSERLLTDIDRYVVLTCPRRLPAGEQLRFRSWRMERNRNWPFRDMTLSARDGATFVQAGGTNVRSERVSDFLVHYRRSMPRRPRRTHCCLGPVISQQTWNARSAATISDVPV